MSGIGKKAATRWAPTRAVVVMVIALVVAALAAAAGATPAAATAAPAGTASPQAAVGATSPAGTQGGLSAGSIVVVRRVGTQDSLWSVDPVTTTATKLIDLPFRPSRLLASPDDGKIALLPAAVGGKVYVFYIVLAKLAPLSFASLGVRQIDGLTWLSATKLLVSGSRSARQTMYPFTDRLYTATTTPGKPAAFRSLKGTDPSAAPGAKLIVYERFRDGGKVAGNPGTRFVLESLVRLKLAAGGKPHVIGHVRYVDSLDILRYRDPNVSPDGKYVVTSTTGSDISVSYMVRRASTGAAVRTFHTTLLGRDATAWSNTGDKVAFWGVPPTGTFTNAYLYVFDPGLKKLTHSAPITNVAVTGFAWAPGDSLLAYALQTPGQHPDKGHLWTIGPGLSGTPTDLGDGSLPVWLP